MPYHPDQYDRFLDEVDLDTDIEDLELDRRQLVLLGRQGRYMRDAFRGMRLDSVELHKELASVRRLVRREAAETRSTLLQAITAQGVEIMATAAELQAAVDAAAVASAATDAQIAQLAGQVQVLIDNGANGIDPADLDPILEGLNALAAGETAQGASVDAVLEVPGEDEPPVEPEPPV